MTDETKCVVMDNITYVLNNFIRCPAYENIIFRWVMHEQPIIDAILEKLDLSDCRIRCISLIAGEEAVRERIASDIAKRIRTPDAMNRSLARLPLYQKLNTVKIDTTGKSVQEICGEIRAL